MLTIVLEMPFVFVVGLILLQSLEAKQQHYPGSVAMMWQKPQLPQDFLEQNAERIPAYF